ncbi:MAG: SAM hydrolase/SAM-dependent halogenase family protein [Bryobacteraceae bacterium]
MPKGPITLTTDFGTRDHFVGAMKGVILSIAPRARIVDITHGIAPYAIAEAAFAIDQIWRHFPKGTIHVLVIDPGVGSARRPILAEAGGQFFIAPDNGVLTAIYDSGRHKVQVVSNPKLMSKQISRTFHGRDVFAPAAAHLARGVPAARFGKRIDDYVRMPFLKPAALAPNRWTGTVLKIDNFGNMITNFRFEGFREIETRPFEMRVGGHRIRRMARTFSDAASGELAAIPGSSGFIEIAANLASAARVVGGAPGDPVELAMF